MILLWPIKFFNNFVDLDSSPFFKLNTNIIRGHSYKISKNLFNNTQLQNNFQNRVIDCWNNLSDNVVSTKSVNSFKNHLDKIDFNKYMKGQALVD